jgi:hypothetical protein
MDSQGSISVRDKNSLFSTASTPVLGPIKYNYSDKINSNGMFEACTTHERTLGKN